MWSRTEGLLCSRRKDVTKHSLCFFFPRWRAHHLQWHSSGKDTATVLVPIRTNQISESVPKWKDQVLCIQQEDGSGFYTVLDFKVVCFRTTFAWIKCFEIILSIDGLTLLLANFVNTSNVFHDNLIIQVWEWQILIINKKVSWYIYLLQYLTLE